MGVFLWRMPGFPNEVPKRYFIFPAFICYGSKRDELIAKISNFCHFSLIKSTVGIMDR